jgi:hypothetical protein
VADLSHLEKTPRLQAVYGMLGDEFQKRETSNSQVIKKTQKLRGLLSKPGANGRKTWPLRLALDFEVEATVASPGSCWG